MSKKRVPSVRPPARPLLDARPKDPVMTAGDRSTNSLTAAPANVTDLDIAHRAYDLYLTRGCEHGHDVEDWLQAERDLRERMRSVNPWVM